MKSSTFENPRNLFFSIVMWGVLVIALPTIANAQIRTFCNDPTEPTNAPCVYQFKRIPTGGGTNHEPPIGASGETVGFDFPCSRTLERDEEGENDEYFLYNIQVRDCDEDHPQRIRFRKYKEEYEAFKAEYLRSGRGRNDAEYRKRTLDFENYLAEVELPYTALQSVLILTEDANTGEGRVTLLEYHVKREQNAKLRLWIATRSHPRSYSNKPDIEIQGSGGGTIRSLKRFKGEDAVKNYRTGRYTVSKDRRIVKWAIVDNHGNNIFSAENDDQYQVYVRFYHPA